MFLAPKIFWERPPKFWTGIIKLGLVLTIVQNFTPVGSRISEISVENKTPGVKHKSSRKLSFPGGLKSKMLHFITRQHVLFFAQVRR